MLEQRCPVLVSELLHDHNTGMSEAEENELKDQLVKVMPEAFLQLVDDEGILQDALIDCTEIVHEMVIDSREGIKPDDVYAMKDCERNILALMAIKLINGIEENLKPHVEQRAYEILEGVE